MENDRFRVKLQQAADPQQLSLLQMLGTKLDGLLAAVKSINVSLPKIFDVRGRIQADIEVLPPVRISNAIEIQTEITKAINNLSRMMLQFSENVLKNNKDTKVEIPSSFDIKNDVSIRHWDELINAMEELKKGFNILINKEVGLTGKVEVTNFPIPKIPTPVTHISINALNGFVNTSATTVTTSLTPLPDYGVLANRRALMIYNNGSTTLYIGGSDVTTADGLPVPAGSYSPALDAGIRTIIYGVVASGSTDVRVMEISDIASGM